MSVQISYKKQFTLGLIFIMIILSVVEISIRIYDYFFPYSGFLENGIYESLSIAEKIFNDIISQNLID